jgi:hypothetical protein
MTFSGPSLFIENSSNIPEGKEHIKTIAIIADIRYTLNQKALTL